MENIHPKGYDCFDTVISETPIRGSKKIISSKEYYQDFVVIREFSPFSNDLPSLKNYRTRSVERWHHVKAKNPFNNRYKWGNRGFETLEEKIIQYTDNF